MSGRILITGAASGIGAALYGLLKEAGQDPVGLDLGGTDISCDLTDRHAIQAICADLKGPLAGIAHVAGLPGTAQPDAILSVNTLAPMTLTAALSDRLVAGGSVVAVSSVTALRCTLTDDDKDALLTLSPDALLTSHNAADGKTAYELSKALLNHWILKSAGDLSARGIRINTVSPGPVETPILKDFESSIGADKIAAAANLTGRHGRPQEIAEAIRFLLSPQASWINGTDLKVDGGYHALRALQEAA